MLEALCESEYEIKPQTSHVELYRVLKERGGGRKEKWGRGHFHFHPALEMGGCTREGEM